MWLCSPFGHDGCLHWQTINMISQLGYYPDGKVHSKSHFSLHVSAKQLKHIVWFQKHKLKWNMSRSNCKCSPVHKYCLNQLKMNIFHINNRRGTLCLSQGGQMGSPMCIRISSSHNMIHWYSEWTFISCYINCSFIVLWWQWPEETSQLHQIV